MALFQAEYQTACLVFFFPSCSTCVFLGNFVELIQGGGLCLCEEGASQTSCLGFTLTAVLFMHVSHYHYPSSVTIRSDSVK